MRLIHQLCRAADEPATKGEVVGAYRLNRRRTIILAVLYLVLAVSFFSYTAVQYVSQRELRQHECVERNLNVARSNALYRRLTAYWHHQSGRDDLAALYRSVTLSVPRC